MTHLYAHTHTDVTPGAHACSQAVACRDITADDASESNARMTVLDISLTCKKGGLVGFVPLSAHTRITPVSTCYHMHACNV